MNRKKNSLPESLAELMKKMQKSSRKGKVKKWILKEAKEK